MAEEKLNSTLQENLITLLAYSTEHGRMIANIVDPALFEGEYRTIAEKCVEYWHKHGEAPQNHTGDLISEILENPQNRKANTYRRILMAMSELSDSINTGYVLDKLKSFTRMQRMKAAILRSAEELNSRQELAIADVETIWNELLRTREIDFEPGMRLTEFDRVIAFMQNKSVEFKTGIKQFDIRNFVPYRGGLTLWIAPTGRGKSWALINIGKQAIIQRKKVVHVTLEMSEEETAMRYYQAMFAIPKREADIQVSTFIRKEGKGTILSGFGRADVIPDFTLEHEFIHEELNTRMVRLGNRFSNLIIKKFPMRSLTIDGLRAYLDNIEVTEKFIPDLLILDYIGVTKTDPRNERVTLGRNGEELKGLLEERHMAGVTAQQSSKLGSKAQKVDLGHVAEAWALTNSADQVVTFSQTDAEFRLGFARLFAGKARSDEDKFNVLITQNYKTGQFCLDSIPLRPKYYEFLKENEDEEKDKDDESVEDDDDDEEDE